MNIGQLFVQLDKPFYFVGEQVTGRVFLNLQQPYNGTELSLKLKGWEKVKWIEE
jgi:hypothetical protein